MKKHCSGCKREISWGDAACPFCGTSNRNISAFVFRGAGLTIVTGIVAIAGYGLFQQSLAEMTKQIQENNQQLLNEAFETNTRLKQQILELSSKLESTQNQIALDQSQKANRSNESKTQLADMQKKLAESEDRMQKQDARSSWLSRENARLKQELDTLQDRLEELESAQKNTVSPIPLNNNPSDPVDEKTDDLTQQDGG